ncbi:hypothetical protein HMI56_002675 [Coelomomyces lativittatus]|nr:hypothetical protein HMI56_002675 [Coelomomyces lativittatus]
MEKGYRHRRRSHFSTGRGGRGGRHSQFNFNQYESNASNASNQGNWRSPIKPNEPLSHPSPPTSYSFNATDLIPVSQESSSTSFNVREASHTLQKLFSYVQQQEHQVYPTVVIPKKVGYLGKNSTAIHFLTQLQTLCQETSL